MSRTGDQDNEAHSQRVPIAVPGAPEARDNRRRGIVLSAVVLVGASAVLSVLMLTTSMPSAPAAQSLTIAGDMPGMDHGSGGMPTGSPSPTMASDMPGMDHGPAHTHGSSPSPTSTGDSPWKTHDDSGTAAHSHGNTADMPGMDHGTAAGTTKDRPLAPVLGTFGGASSAVLLTAGFLRRRDRARAKAKQAARAARRTQK
jgi:hypothetical protein